MVGKKKMAAAARKRKAGSSSSSDDEDFDLESTVRTLRGNQATKQARVEEEEEEEEQAPPQDSEDEGGEVRMFSCHGPPYFLHRFAASAPRAPSRQGLRT